MTNRVALQAGLVCAGLAIIGGWTFLSLESYAEGFGNDEFKSQAVSQEESLDVCKAYVGDLCLKLDEYFEKGELIQEDGMMGISYKMSAQKREDVMRQFQNAGAKPGEDNTMVWQGDGAAYEATPVGVDGINLSIYWD